jgi:hypothetical protein
MIVINVQKFVHQVGHWLRLINGSLNHLIAYDKISFPLAFTLVIVKSLSLRMDLKFSNSPCAIKG